MGVIFKNLSNTPTEEYFCDYIEILALADKDKTISYADIYDYFYDNGKLNIIDNQNNNIHDEVPENNKNENNDRWDSKINSCFKFLISRKERYKDFYPFEIIYKNARYSIALKNNLSNSHKKYIYLLLCSNQNYVSCTKLPSDFEELSRIALKNYIPSNLLQCHRFGKSQLSCRYRGNIEDKINKLASDLKYKTKYQQHYFNKNNNGDNGLDIVAWLPFYSDENRDYMLVILGQCATGKDWINKQYEMLSFANNCIEFRTQVMYAMFISYDTRNENNKFQDSAKMSKNLFLIV
ncbi:MAG: hypothetical protein LUC34_05105 [Campylobacter sp.]|nr:hypothetical protein [Campylobacter sp.]